MQRVDISQPFSFNLTGYAEKPTEYSRGEQDVPERVAAWLAENPDFGTVLNEGVLVPVGSVGEVSDEGARVLSDEEAADVEFPEGELQATPDEPAASTRRRRR